MLQTSLPASSQYLTLDDDNLVAAWVWSFTSLGISDGIIFIITVMIFYQLIKQAIYNYHNTHPQQDEESDSSSNSTTSSSTSSITPAHENLFNPNYNGPLIHSPPLNYNRYQFKTQNRKFSMRIFLVIILLLSYVSVRGVSFGFCAVYVDSKRALPNDQNTPVSDSLI